MVFFKLAEPAIGKLVEINKSPISKILVTPANNLELYTDSTISIHNSDLFNNFQSTMEQKLRQAIQQIIDEVEVGFPLITVEMELRPFAENCYLFIKGMDLSEYKEKYLDPENLCTPQFNALMAQGMQNSIQLVPNILFDANLITQDHAEELLECLNADASEQTQQYIF